ALPTCLPCSPPFPYTTLFRSGRCGPPPWFLRRAAGQRSGSTTGRLGGFRSQSTYGQGRAPAAGFRLSPQRHEGGKGQFRDPTARSEEHTSELQSRENLVCRLL